MSGGNIDNNQPSISFYGKVTSEQTVTITMEGDEVTEIQREKEYNYLYFSCQMENSNNNFKITIDGKEVSSFNDNSSEMDEKGEKGEKEEKGDPNNQDSNKTPNNPNSSMITKFNYLVSIIILFLL